jgi:multidrug efflux pump subunit AcrB
MRRQAQQDVDEQDAESRAGALKVAELPQHVEKREQDQQALVALTRQKIQRFSMDIYTSVQPIDPFSGGEKNTEVQFVLRGPDLDRLEEAIRKKELPFTAGFFFGETEGDEQEDDLLFVTNARAAIQAGKTVYYDSWW